MYTRYECPNCGFYEVAQHDLGREECPSCGHRYHIFEEEVDEERYSWLLNDVREHFSFENFVIRDESFLFIGTMISDFQTIKETFEEMEYYPFIREKEGKVYLHLFRGKKEGSSRSIIPIALLIGTVLSVFYAGFSWANPLKEMGFIENTWVTSFIFMIGLILILGSHELAHKFTAVERDVEAAGPYFIPLPLSPIGTLGALIRIKSPIPSKKAAIRLGISGPLIGFTFSIIVLSVGLMISPVVPAAEYTEAVTAFNSAHPDAFTAGFGTTLIFEILSTAIVDVPNGYNLVMHPLTVAGFIGVFVTALNLMPMGQLDGGHIARSILGKRHHEILSKVIAFSLVGIGLVGALLDYTIWPGWIIWGCIGYLIASRGHPGAMDEVTALTTEDKLLAVLGIIIFILCFTPTPIYVVL